VIDEIIAANDRVAVKNLRLEHKVNLLHIEVEILVINDPLEFLQ